MFWRVKSVDSVVAAAHEKGLKPAMGGLQLMLFGIGAIIGTGIFVLTSEAAQKAGPGMMVSFVIAAMVCAVAALCYSEMAAMVPVCGSAYTYAYAVIGEHVAWVVGWALILEYTLAGSAVAVGWSGYVVGLTEGLLGIQLPELLTRGPIEGGLVNLPAGFVALAVTGLLVVGTRESAIFNSLLVFVKIAALTAFIVLSLPLLEEERFIPFAPAGLDGISAAAASIFFAYVGFDAVSTAAEETRNPQRNVPIGLLGSLGICTAFYLLVAAGVIGTVGAQPLTGASGGVLEAGSAQLAAACAQQTGESLVCSREALAFTLREIGFPQVANMLGLAVGFALPSVVLLMIFGQTRIFFVMARDGLLPQVFARVHPRYHTPHLITCVTGSLVALFAAFVPLGRLADLSNAGTLLAFFIVALATMILRRTEPSRKRPFRTPALWLVGPLAIAGCLYLFWSLSLWTQLMTLAWAAIGIVVYLAYGYRNSIVGREIAVGPSAGSAQMSATEAAPVDR